MRRAGTGTQTSVIGELTLASGLDEAFALARRLLRGEVLAYWLLVVAAGLALGVGLCASAWSDLVVSRAATLAPALLVLVGALRLGLAATEIHFGVVLAWHAFELERGALPRRASHLRAVALGLLLSLPAVALGFLPQLVLLRVTLSRGVTTLLPAAWWSGDIEGIFIAIFLIGIVVWPAARLAPAVLVVEGGGPLRALLRSARVVYSSRGLPHAVEVSFLLVQLVLGWGLANLAHVFTGEPRALGPVAQAGVGLTLPTLFGATLLSAGMLAWECVLAPQRGMAFFLSYVDQRVRRDGLDVLRDGCRAGLIRPEDAR